MLKPGFFISFISEGTVEERVEERVESEGRSEEGKGEMREGGRITQGEKEDEEGC